VAAIMHRARDACRTSGADHSVTSPAWRIQMDKTKAQQTPSARESTSREKSFVVGFHGVRYQVKDVARAVDFYTNTLGFELRHQQLPAFALVSIEHLSLFLSGPGASGSRPLPGGRSQEPGGWNRVVLRVNDLPARIKSLKTAGLPFRNEMEVGPGGRQIQLEDPDGNAIELFEPAQP
jgi:glyoxylase I family protein